MNWLTRTLVLALVAVGGWQAQLRGAPTITCPANVTVSNDPSQCGAVVNYPSPLVTGAIASSTSPTSGSFFPVGSTTVTCTAVDFFGAVASCFFTVTVVDTEPPSITCPANITVPNDQDQCGAVVNYGAPVVSDNCPGTLAVCTPASGSFFPQGSTTVTCQATDAAGNTSTCSFTVIISDVQAPDITCPSDSNLPADANCQAVVPDYEALVTASDNCQNVVITQVPSAGTLVGLGPTVVTVTATDEAGNQSSCQTMITVTSPVSDGDGIPDCNDPYPNTVGMPPTSACGGLCGAGAAFAVPVAMSALLAAKLGVRARRRRSRLRT